MLKALVWKELRELLPIVVVALIVQKLLLLGAMRLTDASPVYVGSVIPFASGAGISSFFYVAAIAAIGAGLWQTWWESGRGTFHFLLHRPIPRSTLFTIKLLVGAGACLVISGLPVLLYAIWAATPGTHASPFFWSMTLTAWIHWASLPLVYLGAFLCGLRPAWLFGSRAFPLAAGILSVLALGLLQPWPLIALPMTLLVTAGFLIAIFFVATTRDYS